MSSPSRNWSVGPFTVWRSRLFGRAAGGLASASNPTAVKIEGARINDRDTGLAYEATIERADGQVWLTSITILTTRKGQRIDQSTIRRVPVQRIAEQVAIHLAGQEATGMPTFMTNAPPVRGERPSPQVVAQQWKDGWRRTAFASHYGVSVYTVDDWLREARDLHLIPKAKTGRPRKKEEQE